MSDQLTTSVQIIDMVMPMSWEFFIKILGNFCEAQGWYLEYVSPEDRVCVIYASPDSPSQMSVQSIQRQLVKAVMQNAGLVDFEAQAVVQVLLAALVKMVPQGLAQFLKEIADEPLVIGWDEFSDDDDSKGV